MSDKQQSLLTVCLSWAVVCPGRSGWPTSRRSYRPTRCTPSMPRPVVASPLQLPDLNHENFSFDVRFWSFSCGLHFFFQSLFSRFWHFICAVDHIFFSCDVSLSFIPHSRPGVQSVTPYWNSGLLFRYFMYFMQFIFYQWFYEIFISCIFINLTIILSFWFMQVFFEMLNWFFFGQTPFSQKKLYKAGKSTV